MGERTNGSHTIFEVEHLSVAIICGIHFLQSRISIHNSAFRLACSCLETSFFAGLDVQLALFAPRDAISFSAFFRAVFFSFRSVFKVNPQCDLPLLIFPHEVTFWIFFLSGIQYFLLYESYCSLQNILLP